jgi:hypothetical protein
MLTVIAIIFVIGYLAITTEHTIKINKAASTFIYMLQNQLFGW